jgi:hypothetical protein
MRRLEPLNLIRQQLGGDRVIASVCVKQQARFIDCLSITF